MVGVISVCIPMLIFVVMWFKRKDFDMKTIIIQTIHYWWKFSSCGVLLVHDFNHDKI